MVGYSIEQVRELLSIRSDMIRYSGPHEGVIHPGDIKLVEETICRAEDLFLAEFKDKEFESDLDKLKRNLEGMLNPYG